MAFYRIGIKSGFGKLLFAYYRNAYLSSIADSITYSSLGQRLKHDRVQEK